MSKVLGDYGERLAEDYLVGKGHRIIGRNYNCRFGEVDLITVYEDVLHFVEVKTVKSQTLHPLEQITPKKIGRLCRTMAFYLKAHKCVDACVSLDALGITLYRGEEATFYYEENITL
ncbi:MAG: YraN family protein [Clostridia bacterium]|nr:YraN family protein [Clostridia bacterium]